jgi:exopolysaccharide production protein ExoZ
MKRLNSIQYIRATAALSVLIFHSLESSASRFPVGAAGVDVFFVVSGYIMGSLMSAEETKPGSFIGRRLAGIVPAYWICTLAAVIVYRIKPGIFYQFDPRMDNLIQSLFFIPHRGATPEGSPILVQGWTLEYEMFFYLACTTCLLLPKKQSIPALVILLLGLAICGAWLHPEQKIWATYTSPLLVEFAAGLGLAMAWRAQGPPGFRYMAWILAGSGLAVFAGEATGIIPISGIRVLDWGVPAVMIVAGALIAEHAGIVPIWRGGLMLGDASYALYLSHGFVLAPFLVRYSGAPLALRVLVCASLAVILAIIINKMLEAPLQDLLRKAVGPGRIFERT